MNERPSPLQNPEAFPLPQISPKQLVYEDRNRQIFRVAADFGSFTKEYFVSESGQRVGLVLEREGSILLVRQYRLGIRGLSWEIPGGKVDDGETPEVAAVREGIEETGIRSFNLKPLLSYQAGLDALHNPTYIFYSSEFETDEVLEPDPQEVWEQHWIPLPQALQMVFDGQIVDALSIVAVLTYTSLGARNNADVRLLKRKGPSDE